MGGGRVNERESFVKGGGYDQVCKRTQKPDLKFKGLRTTKLFPSRALKVGKYSVLRNFSGRKTFSKIVALIV